MKVVVYGLGRKGLEFIRDVNILMKLERNKQIFIAKYVIVILKFGNI